MLNGWLNVFKLNRFPPDTPEKGQNLGNFFKNQGAPPKTASKIPSVVKEIEKAYPDIKTWGAIGVHSLSADFPIKSIIANNPLI